MKCSEVQELLPLYWDLSDQDWRKKKVDAHLKHCPVCSADYNIWEESRQLITAQFPAMETAPASRISQNVMNRIYADESWRIPIPERMYSFSYRLKRNLNFIVCVCLALFTISFFYSLLDNPKQFEMVSNASGIIPVALAPVDADFSAVQSTSMQSMQGVPVASIHDPVIWHISPIESYPDYLLVVSIIGLIATILVMSWLSRTKT